MTSLERELEHLARSSRWHPNCAEYCMAKAEWLALRRPEDFEKLPHLLMMELRSSDSVVSGTRAGKSSTAGS
uniref:Uncharacterized protein n=1 Tax=Variovorax sp. HH01 TaxID=1084736 RepID=I3PCR0_9BURK|nr:hypothetical protein var090 [Variovorax sp. HH01]